KGNIKFIPKRKLKFAEFLYYNHVISWKDYIRAIIWQKTQRDKIGEIAVRWNYIEKNQLYFILENKKSDSLTGQLMIQYGYISPFQLKVILYQQKKQQPKIGKFFLKNKILSTKELRYYLFQHRLHNLEYLKDK
ncbi:hypothetical protein, partial [Desulfothermus okinawensis]